MASTVGSIGGNVTLIAGEQYKQVGSDVMAPKSEDIYGLCKNLAGPTTSKNRNPEVIVMKGTIAVTRSLQKNANGYYDFELTYLGLGAFDAFNQIFSVALADYPEIREVVQEMEVIYQMNFYELNSNDFNTAIKELERFF